MFKPKGPFCQSCGMPLSRDSLGGGTNADGSSSTEYCSHCFRGFMARHFARGIPSLRRWQSRPGAN